MNGVCRATSAMTNALLRHLHGYAALATVLVYTGLVGALGLTLHPRLLLLLPALALVLVVGAVWPWLTLLLVRGHLHFPTDRVHEGEDVFVSLKLRYRALWPAWGLSLEIDGPNGRILETVRPFCTVDIPIALGSQHRGLLPRHTPRLRTGFPFGLVTASRRVTCHQVLVVWPRVFPVAAPPDWASADMAVGHVDTRRIGNEGDTVGVREFRRGDPMRWIHWSQTARHDRFMVREFQAGGMPRVRIVLDCDVDVHVGEGPDRSFEWAVRIAASLATGWLASGAEVGLLAGTQRLPAAGGDCQRARILDALADVQPCPQKRSAMMPKGELATVFVSTDLGWGKRPEPHGCVWRGLMLRTRGFGGTDHPSRVFCEKVVVMERPDEVSAALQRVRWGLADVA